MIRSNSWLGLVDGAVENTVAKVTSVSLLARLALFEGRFVALGAEKFNFESSLS